MRSQRRTTIEVQYIDDPLQRAAHLFTLMVRSMGNNPRTSATVYSALPYKGNLQRAGPPEPELEAEAAAAQESSILQQSLG